MQMTSTMWRRICDELMPTSKAKWVFMNQKWKLRNIVWSDARSLLDTVTWETREFLRIWRCHGGGRVKIDVSEMQFQFEKKRNNVYGRTRHDQKSVSKWRDSCLNMEFSGDTLDVD